MIKAYSHFPHVAEESHSQLASQEDYDIFQQILNTKIGILKIFPEIFRKRWLPFLLSS